MANVRARRIHKPGLPAKVVQPPSPAARDVFLNAFRREGREDAARRAANVTHKDIEAWRLDDEAFDAAYQECQRLFVEKIEGYGFDLARNGDPAMVRFFLQSLMAEKYGPKAKLEITVRDVSKLSDEELEQHIRQLEGKRS
jgi:hypothetical protein